MNSPRSIRRISAYALCSVVALAVAVALLGALNWLQASAAPVAPPPPDAVDESTIVPCSYWRLSADFHIAPHQENPNRDTCGNPAVWHFMESAGLARDPQTYSLLAHFTTTSDGVPGLHKWSGSTFRPPPDGFPEVVFNTTGTTQSTQGNVIPSNVAAAHPGDGTLAVVGWRSPITGVVAIAGTVTGLNSGGRIRWYVDKGAAGISSGGISGGGAQNLRDGIGGSALAAVSVGQGEFIYFLIDPDGSLFNDLTQLDISIVRVSNTSTTLSVVPNPSVSAQPVTFTATVTSTLGTPTGSVSFILDGTPIATRPLTSGQAGYTVSLTWGTHHIRAGYAGEGQFEPSGSDTLFQTVRPLSVYLPQAFFRWPPYPGPLTLSPIQKTAYNTYALNWTPASLAAAYSLEEDTSAAFANPHTVYSGSGQTWQSGARTPGTYCYRARGWNSFGGGPWSNVQCITVTACQPLDADDFSNPASGYPVLDTSNYAMGYVEGEYRILVKPADWMAYVWDEFGVSDYRVEVDARAAGHLDGSVGIIFGKTSAGHYRYQVSNGHFILVRRDEAASTSTALISWTSSPAIRTGTQANRLKVVRSGAEIRLYANGQEVAHLIEGTYRGDGIGLQAAASTANFEGRFDNVAIYGSECLSAVAQRGPARAGWREDVAPR